MGHKKENNKNVNEETSLESASNPPLDSNINESENNEKKSKKSDDTGNDVPASKQDATHTPDSEQDTKKDTAHTLNSDTAPVPDSKKNATSNSKQNAAHRSDSKNTSCGKKCGGRLIGFSFLLALIALAFSGCNYYLRMQASQNNVPAANIDAINQKVALIQKQLKDNESNKPLSASEISTLINKKVTESVLSKDDLKALITQINSQNTLSKKEIADMITSQISAVTSKNSNQTNLDEATVTQLIDEQVKNGLSQESQLNTKLNDEIKTLEDTVKNLQKKLNTASAANPEPIIAALTSANIANQNGNYKTALAYVNQALKAFDLYKLNASSYAQFKPSIVNVQAQLQKLSVDPTMLEKIRALIDGSSKWPLAKMQLTAANGNDPALAADDDSATLPERLQNIGQAILDKSFKITKISESNLVWINADQRLVAIIKENLRLDLIAVQNALINNDANTLAILIPATKKEIDRYFNTNNASVKSGLAALDKILNAKNNAPDIDSVIKSINQIGGSNND